MNMKKTITSALFLGMVAAISSSTALTNNFSNEINNVDDIEFLLDEQNPSINTIKQLSMGGTHSAAITTDDQGQDHLYTWGSNDKGQLGLGTIDKNPHNTPKEIDINGSENPDDKKIKQVSLGEKHSAVITTDDQGYDHLYTWGDNDKKQLGRGEIKNPEQINELYFEDSVADKDNILKIKQVSLGAKHSAAITTEADGKDHLYTWGSNNKGQIGDGTQGSTLGGAKDKDRPVKIDINGSENSDDKTIKQVSLGNEHSAAITTDNQGQDHLYAWGNNNKGQLGNGNNQNVFKVPKKVNLNDTKIKQVSLGNEHSAAITTNNKEENILYITGSNVDGIVGNGTNDKTDKFTKITLGNETILKQVSLGQTHSSAITTDNEGKDHLYTWGKNSEGQLGNGDTTNSVNKPNIITIDSDLINIEQIKIGKNQNNTGVNIDFNLNLNPSGNSWKEKEVTSLEVDTTLTDQDKSIIIKREETNNFHAQQTIHILGLDPTKVYESSKFTLTFEYKKDDNSTATLIKTINIGEISLSFKGIGDIEFDNTKSPEITTLAEQTEIKFTPKSLNSSGDEFMSVADLKEHQIGVYFEYNSSESNTETNNPNNKNKRENKIIKADTTKLKENESTTVTVSGLTPNTTYKGAKIVYKLEESFNMSQKGQELGTLEIGDIITKSYSKPTLDNEEVKKTISKSTNSIEFDLEFKSDVEGDKYVPATVIIDDVQAINKKTGKKQNGVKISSSTTKKSNNIEVNGNGKTHLKISGLKANTTYSDINVTYKYKDSSLNWITETIKLGEIKTDLPIGLIVGVSLAVLLIIIFIAVSTTLYIKKNKNKEDKKDKEVKKDKEK